MEKAPASSVAEILIHRGISADSLKETAEPTSSMKRDQGTLPPHTSGSLPGEGRQMGTGTTVLHPPAIWVSGGDTGSAGGKDDCQLPKTAF